MIIFGTTGITSVERKGTFCCPACGAGANYQEKGVRRFFTLFFIPLIPLDKANQYVLCDRCGGTFKPEVLTWNGIVPQTGGPPPLPGEIMGPPPPRFAGQSTTSTVSYQANHQAKTSMVLGIIGLVTSFLICPSVFLALLGLIFGILGLNRANKGKGLIGGKNQAITGIVCSVISFLVIAGVAVMTAKDSKHKAIQKSPREKISQSLRGSAQEAAQGNTPEAKTIAQKYATLLDSMRDEAFASSKSRNKSSRHVVHCELHDGTCALLVVVPDYRKFTDDAKDSFEQIAWKSANMLLKEEAAIKPTTELCVGLKGLVMFGSIMTGSLGQETPANQSKEESDMDRFFPAALPSATPNPAEKGSQEP